MLLAASESAVTKKPRLRLTMRRSSSESPFGSFQSWMSRLMLISCGIQWLAQAAMYFSQAHLYLNGTSWLTSAFELMIFLSSTVTRRNGFSAGAGRAGRPAGGASGARFSKFSMTSQASLLVRIACASSSVRRLGSWGTASVMNSGRYSRQRARTAAVRSAVVESASSWVAMNRLHSEPTIVSHSRYLGCCLISCGSARSAAWQNSRARKVSSRQPGAITANTPALFGGDHSGAMNGPAKLRLPRVITSPPRGSLTGLAVGLVDRAHLGRLGGFHGNRVQLPGLAGRLLGMRGAERAQVVGGLQAADPGELVGLVELLARGAGHVDVERLRLVDPLLAARRALDQPLRLDLEGGGIKPAQLRRRAVDARQVAVEVLEVRDHHLVPEPGALQVGHQILVHHGELAREVRLHEQVLVGRLDRGRHADDVGDGRGRRDGEAVRVAHAVLLNAAAQRLPVEVGGTVELDVAAALGREDVERVLRQDAPLPERAVERGVAAALLGKLGRGPVRGVRHHLHGAVGELHRLVRGVRDAQLVQAVL